MKDKILKIIIGGFLGYGIMLFGFVFVIFSAKFIQYEVAYLVAVWLVILIGFILGIFLKRYIAIGSSFIFLSSLGFRYLFERVFDRESIFIILGSLIVLLIIGWLLGFAGQWLWKTFRRYFLKEKN